MSARLLAAFALSNLVMLPGWGSDRPETEVVVYLSGGALQPQRPLEVMKAETARLMAPAGYRVKWSDSRPTTDSALVVLELHGTCEAGGAAGQAGALASTATSDGQIIPFSSVDCAALSRILAGALAFEPASRRDFLYGRAMARLVAHELHHVLARTTGHGRDGITRACLRANELLADRFQQLRTPASARTALPSVPSLPETPRM